MIVTSVINKNQLGQIQKSVYTNMYTNYTSLDINEIIVRGSVSQNAETHSALLRLACHLLVQTVLGVMPHVCWAGSRTSPAASDGWPLGMIAMSGVVVLSEHVAGLVAVVAAVSVAAVLAGVHVSAPVEGHSRTSPTASDGFPLGMMLVTVGEAADVLVAVPCPDLLFGLCPFPTFDVAAGALPLSPFGLEEPLLADRCGISLRHVGTFFTLAGGGMACFLASLGGTLAALMGGRPRCDWTS
ncbi:hypothetical protein NDU88_000948 [Pleurodeles waltl]|uniref:Uncharacterized protein n=1 Tax=Pleurodeles waltl TaxID=8319 RepID=A0AAV7SYG6_PLEWA|nr:hypothetical protein NDU88_000948 [Pleurodeles waltl]